jgi:hypothetical protein
VSGGPRGQPQEGTLEDFLSSAVDEALERAFDASTAKAFRFYIDTNILLKNPDAYADSVRRIFGKEGGEVVLKSITKNICEKAKLPVDPTVFFSLRECVTAVAKQYRSR